MARKLLLLTVLGTAMSTLSACQVGLTNPIYLRGGFTSFSENPSAPMGTSAFVIAKEGGRAEVKSCARQVYVHNDGISTAQFTSSCN